MRNLSSASQASASQVALAFLAKKRGRPSLPDLILRAVFMSSPGRKGASLAAIKKALLAEGYDVQKNNGRLKAALSALVTKGLLRRVTGSGVSGSFKLNKSQTKGSASKKTKEKTALKRARTRIAAKRSPKKINSAPARKAKGAGRKPKPPVKRPKARKSPARPKGRGVSRGKAAGKRR